ncbi:hypothetical protein [Nocardia cyriacigeorgica]|nr:hypothetical protein [Nocardia cyriacigeorgica]
MSSITPRVIAVELGGAAARTVAAAEDTYAEGLNALVGGLLNRRLG